MQSTSQLNCETLDGSLKRGIGIAFCRNQAGEPLSPQISVDINQVYEVTMNPGGDVADTSGMYLGGKDGGLYEYNRETGAVLKRYVMGGNISHVAIKCETGRIYNVFTGDEKVVMTVDGTRYSTLVNGHFCGSCACGGRYFVGTVEKKLFYSAPFRPHVLGGTSNEGGELYLPAGYGEIMGLQEDGGFVYVFMKRGIFRVEVGADVRAFRIKQVAYNGGSICNRAMISTGKGIIFLSTSGAYLVRGESAEKIVDYLHIQPMPGDYIYMVGKFDEFVVLDYREKKSAREYQVRRVVISTDGKKGYFCDRYATLSGGEYCSYARGIYVFEQESEETKYRLFPFFQSVPVTFGTERRKALKKLRLTGQGEGATIRIVHDEGWEDYSLLFENRCAEVDLSGRGKSFIFRIYPLVGSKIESMDVDYVCTEA